MEDKNRFDLEKALRAWREDCASRPGISLEDAKELESDLRERVADLQQQGLNEADAFQEAARQVGSPGVLAREFARENPWAVWHDRLIWMVVAGFAVSVWRFMSYGTISSILSTFGVLLPFHFSTGALVTLAGNLPVLALAVLLATGKIAKLAGRFDYFLQSRQRFAFTGMGLLAVGVLLRVFGPNPLLPPEGLGLTILYLLSLSAWPLVLLSFGVFLIRPISSGESARSRFQMVTVPSAVWRERVCWMSLGGLMLGLWQVVSGLGIRAVFYPGNINKPLNMGPLLLSVLLVVQLSPFIILVLLRQRMRKGKNIAGVGRRRLFIIIPTLLCAWIGLNLWSSYLSVPQGFTLSLPALLTSYLSTFHWFWQFSLAALLLWLAPSRSGQRQHSEFAK